MIANINKHILKYSVLSHSIIDYDPFTTINRLTEPQPNELDFRFFFRIETKKRGKKHLNIWLCQNESDWMLCVSFGIVYIRTIDILYIYMYYNEHTAQHIQKYFGWFSSNIDHFHIIIVYEQLTKQHRMDGWVILTVCALCRCSVFRCDFLPFSVQISMEMLVA